MAGARPYRSLRAGREDQRHGRARVASPAMRVGLVLEQLLAPVPGGTGRYSREIAAALARRAPSGSTVVGATAWHRARVELPNIEVRRMPLPRRPLIASWERGVGPSVDADLVHAPTPLAPPRRKTPLVVTVHDAVPWTHPTTLTRRGARWHRRAIERAARDADAIVVPTQAVADELRHHLQLGDRVRVVGHGTNLAIPVDADARAGALELPDRYLLTV